MIKDVLAMFNALVKLVVLMKANNIPLLYPTIYLLRKWLGPLSISVLFLTIHFLKPADLSLLKSIILKSNPSLGQYKYITRV